MKWLSRVQFGDPKLRKRSRQVTLAQLATPQIQSLIQNMRHTLTSLELGVGLAAPQVGENKAIIVICIQPLPHRPTVVPFEAVLVNPKITRYIGRPKQQWEGCISSGDGQAGLFGKVPRYPKVEVQYRDEHGRPHKEIFSGLPAHVAQHEVDHLHGVLFVDRVLDTKSYMTYEEYLKRVRRGPRV